MTHVEVPQSACLFGIARGDITPPVGIYHRMWGAAVQDLSTGVHRALSATAMIFGNASETLNEADKAEHRFVVFITMDHCLLGTRELDLLKARVSRGSNRSFAEIHVTFSHTHSAGLMNLDRRDEPGGDLIEPYVLELAEKLSDLVIAAEKSLRPCHIVYGTGRCNLAVHRDFHDSDLGGYVCGYNPSGAADDTLLVGRVTSDEDGGVLAILVNYACHPTTLGWKNSLISPDFPGAMRELVERHHGGVCVFLQGASGDLSPRECYVGDPEIADRHGRQLGYAVLSVMESLPAAKQRFCYAGHVVSGATLGMWEYQPHDESREKTLLKWRCRFWNLNLPLRPDIPSRAKIAEDRNRWQGLYADALDNGQVEEAAQARARAEQATRMLYKLEALPESDMIPLPIAAWQMGDAIWIALESEYYQILQTTLRERHPGVPIVIVTLTDGWRVSYLPPAELYGLGIYQEQVAMLAPGTLETMIEHLDQTIREWRTLEATIGEPPIH